MIYPDNFESKLKFDKVRTLIKGYCQSSMGKELVEQMEFTSDYSAIQERLGECGEMMEIIAMEDSFPTGSFLDTRDLLNKIRVVGLFPEVPELVALKNGLESVHSVVRFFSNKEDTYPLLTDKSGSVLLFPYVLDRLNSIVSKNGTIKDNASRELSTIRTELQRKQSTISKRIHALLQMAQQEGWADKDSSIAVRDGRMVIPVPSAYKRKIKGIVHDESATGKTSYIEPTEIVETNNEIRELELEERREIIRILRQFADDIRPYIDDLLYSFDFLAYIDFVRAKSLFAVSIDGAIPKVVDEPIMEWYHARHPLLALTLKNLGREIIPLKLILNEEDRIVLISGPNAGGKSVCLQSAGMLQYLMQCGVPVSMSDASTMGVFSKILVDMGDEQSIDNDLSTYSSHLINMRNFIKYGDKRTLILIDEFGTGTEPMLGGALAETILDELNQMHVKGVITTHYTNLKHFAQAEDGVVNGAMLYDSHNMMPLFKLEIGKPGSSFAFEIAHKIGLPPSILQRAKDKIGAEHIDYDKHLREIARDKRYWEEKRRRIRENEKKLDQVVEKYSTELDDASRMKKEIIKEAQIKAQAIIDQANKEIEITIKKIKESQAEKEQTKLLRRNLAAKKEELLHTGDSIHDEKIRRKMEKIKAREERKSKRSEAEQLLISPENSTMKALEVGDSVRLKNGAVAEILSIDGKNATLALGQLRTTSKLKDLEWVSSNQAKKISRGGLGGQIASFREELSKKRMSFKGDIDVRGMRAEEAVQKVEEFVDEAVMLDFKDLRILHGTGTGVLRQLIRKYLHAHPNVSEAKDEQVQLGGAGITVVKIK